MLTTLTEFEAILISCLPALTAVIANFSMLVTFIKSLAKLKDNEEVKKERDALVEQNKATLAECRKLRKQMALYIEKAVKVHYKDMTEVQNDKDLQI